MADLLVENSCTSCGASIEDINVTKCPYCLNSLQKSTKGQVKPCPNCGSSVTFNINKQQFDCQNCQTTFNLVKEQEITNDKFKAEKIFTFHVSEDLAKVKFYEWLSKGKNVPLGILDKADNIRLEQLYVPFVDLSVSYKGTWSADIGYDRTETYTEYVTRKDSKGKKYSEPVTKNKVVTDWQHMKDDFSGNVRKYYVVADEEQEMAKVFNESIHSFERKKVQPISFDEHYFSGTNQLEINQGTVVTSRNTILASARSEAEIKMKGLLPGDKNRKAKIVSFSPVSKGHYLYVPFWKVHYTYKENDYNTLVSAFNSEDCRLAGIRPVNKQQFNVSRKMRTKGRLALLIGILAFFGFKSDLSQTIRSILLVPLFGGAGVWAYYMARRIMMYFSDRKQLKNSLNNHAEYQSLLRKIEENSSN